jgi:ABC-type transporter Mla maintaining outer membrane lipid asymmetry permease subunit MlaE
MTDLILQPNTLFGIVSAIGFTLIAIAFRSYAPYLRGDAVRHLGAALFWIGTMSAGRIIWWDVFHGFGLGIGYNAMWALIGMYGGYHALSAVYQLIPVEDRDGYNIITAVFYPASLAKRFRKER